MPTQEIFLDHQVDDGRVQIVKTYDEQYAREAFAAMDADGRAHLWRALDIDADYEPEDIPIDEIDRADLLLEEMLSAGREDWNTVSYFVVSKVSGGVSTPVYVSPDWPSAEAIAKSLIGG